MREGYYGKEPFDLRLTGLRFLRSLDKILILTLAGTILFGGGYYLKKVVLRPEKEYSATSVYKVEYVTPPRASGDYFINETTWNTFVQSREFLSAVQGHLTSELSLEELSGAISAKLPSDWYVPTTTVVSREPEKTLQIAAAVEKAMTEDFVKISQEVAGISVITAADGAEEVALDVRPVRAMVLSGLLSFLFAAVFFLLKEIGDDSIWLPASLHRRYGLHAVGTVQSLQLRENLDYLFRGRSRIAVCPLDARVDSGEVVKAIGGETQEWIPMPGLTLCPESCRSLREMDGILLAVPAGRHVGKALEAALEYLEQQDCPVLGALLWDADEWLLKAYYRLDFGREGC